MALNKYIDFWQVANDHQSDNITFNGIQNWKFMHVDPHVFHHLSYIC